MEQTTDSEGEKTTVSAGQTASVEAGGLELSITGEAFYSQGTGGKYKGQQSFGTRLAADATYVSHKTVVVDPRNGITKTSTTQTSVGVSVTKEFPVKPVK